jgi:hypothetical protein
MGADKSNLAGYGYNMTVAVSESAVNSQFVSYLIHAENKKRVYFLDDGSTAHNYFKVDSTSDDKTIPAAYGEDFIKVVQDLAANKSSLYKVFEGMNIFNTVYKKDSDGQWIVPGFLKTAYDTYFLNFCFEIAEGLPVKDAPDEVLELHAGDNSVTYTQYFKEFTLIEVGCNNRKKQYNMSIESQSESKTPWEFVYEIPVNFFSSSYTNIKDKAVADRIKEMSKITGGQVDDIFEISTLALNLKRLSTLRTPKFKISALAAAAVVAYVEEYLGTLEQAGTTIFGYTVKPKPGSGLKYIFLPKQYTFTISGGDIKTLNYIIMFDESQFPAIRDFNWKWLDKGDVYDGVMAFNRDKFCWKFMEEFRKEILSRLRYKPTSSASGGVYKAEFGIGVQSDKSTDTQLFKPGGSEYIYSYSESSSTDRVYIWGPPSPWPIASGAVSHNYNFTCKVSKSALNNSKGASCPALCFDTRVWAYADFDHDYQDNDGIYFDSNIKCNLGFDIDRNGNIIILKKVEVTNNNPKGLDIKLWSKIDTAGTIDRVKDSANKIGGVIKTVEDHAKDVFLKEFLICSNWVMPGCRTFTYEAPLLSDNWDFCSYINYAQEK